MRKKETISKILKLKDSRKKEIEVEVKQAAEIADREKSRLKALEKDYHDSIDFFNRKNEEGSIDINRIKSYYDFFYRIHSKIEDQKKVHIKRQNELNMLKKSLVDAHKDKRTFEIMKEKAEKKEKKKKLDSEQQEADFLSITRKTR